MPLLYKFASPSGIKYMLENRTLSFTSLSCLNDINEGMADIAAIVASESKDCVERMYSLLRFFPGNALYGSTPDQFRAYCERIGLTQDVFDVSAKRLGWQITLKKYSQFGILSLAQSRSNLLMWGHYTNEGRGICIGLEPSASVFEDSEYGGVKGLHPVSYSDERIKMDADTLEARLKAAVFTKSKDWEYESEVRCVRQVASGDNRTVVDFDPGIVKEIILGPRMALADVKKCHEIHKHSFSHAELLHAVPNPSRFEMDIEHAAPTSYLDLLWSDDVDGVNPLRLPSA